MLKGISMIPVPNEILEHFTEAFSFESKEMKKIGGERTDSDGIFVTAHPPPYHIKKSEE